MRLVLVALAPLLAGCEAVVFASNVLPALSAAVANKIPEACFFDASYVPGPLLAVPVVNAQAAVFTTPPAECGGL